MNGTKIAQFLAYILVAMITAACTPNLSRPHRLTIIATLFPQYDFAKQIARDKADVVLLLPAGVEPHHFEPSPNDMMRIRTADLFILTNPEMEPWAVKMATMLPATVGVLNASQGIPLSIAGANDANDTHLSDGADPHVWLDPLLAKKMVGNITMALCQKDPKNAAFYQKNAAEYQTKLTQLDQRFRHLFDRAHNKKIVLGGHSAFGYFSKRYGVAIVSPYRGFSPDAEPSPTDIATVINTLNASGQHVVFYEELLSPNVAKVLSKATGSSLILLHAAHNLSKDELDRHVSYLDIMSTNADHLESALIR